MLFNDTSAQFRPFGVLERLEIKPYYRLCVKSEQAGLLASIKAIYKLKCKLLNVKDKYVNNTLVHRCIRLLKR